MDFLAPPARRAPKGATLVAMAEWLHTCIYVVGITAAICAWWWTSGPALWRVGIPGTLLAFFLFQALIGSQLRVRAYRWDVLDGEVVTREGTWTLQRKSARLEAAEQVTMHSSWLSKRMGLAKVRVILPRDSIEVGPLRKEDANHLVALVLNARITHEKCQATGVGSPTNIGAGSQAPDDKDIAP